jgi:hypothetical protein
MKRKLATFVIARLIHSLSLALLLAFCAIGATAQSKGPIFVTVGNGLATAKGKWKATTGRPGDEVAFKHAVAIECSKSSRECLECTANVVEGEPDVQLEHYEIVRWDANGILAQNDSPDCMTNQLVINFKEQSVMAIDAPKKGTTKNWTTPARAMRSITAKYTNSFLYTDSPRERNCGWNA